MRSLIQVALLGLALCAAWHPASIAAQSVAEARARAEELFRAEQVSRAQGERESLEQLRVRQSDTVLVGGLRIVVRAREHRMAEGAAQLAWPMITARYGRLAEELSRYPLLLEPVDSAASAFSVTARLPNGSVTSQGIGATTETAAAGLVRYADLLLWANADSALRAWYPSMPDPGLDSSITAERVYLDLVTSPAVQARSCLVGDGRACSEALGLRPVEDPLLTSYDPAGRRELAWRLRERFERSTLGGAYHGCVDDARDAECVRILRAALAQTEAYHTFTIPAAVGDGPRRALVAQVVRLGGPDAWGRLLASPGQPLEDRLATAAGMPIDSLMRVWRRGIIAARPIPVSVTPLAAVAALGWVVVGLAFALRFSRWH